MRVYSGEIQCAALGMDVDIFDQSGKSLKQKKGERQENVEQKERGATTRKSRSMTRQNTERLKLTLASMALSLMRL